MSEQEQQKKKIKKSYQDLLEEAKTLLSNTAAVMIPRLCEAFRDENPELTNKEIETQIYIDCEGFWVRSYIRDNLPSWIHNQNMVRASKRAWEKRNAEKLEKATKIITNLAHVELPESKLPEPQIDEETDSQLHVLGVAPYGETGKSTRELTGEISEHAYKLFAALTNNTTPPNTGDDLLVDYIRPSREFRRGLMLEVDSHRRTAIHNALHYASVAIEDMLEIIKEIDEKEQ